MRRKIIQLGAVLFCSSTLVHAVTIHHLLDNIKKQPSYQLDTLAVSLGALSEQKIKDKQMPTLNGFAGLERYNRPSSLRPVLPSEMQRPQKGLPFSKHIGRIGADLTWSVFVKSLYTLQKKAALMHLAAKEKQRLNFISKEAEVVGSVAYLKYLSSLKQALNAKKRSIYATRKKVALMVKEGRAAPSELLRLDTHINEIEVNLVNLDRQIDTLSAKIETLTGIALRYPLPLHQKHKIHKGKIFALMPLAKKVEASKAGVKAAKEGYYPSIALKGKYTYSRGEAYNNHKTVDSDFGSLGVFVTMPLYDRSKSTSVEEAKLFYLKEKAKLEDTRLTLTVKAKKLEREIRLLKRAFRLARKNIRDQKELLKVAKVSLEEGVITQEEYLRYEDALANARAEVAKIESEKWQDIAQLALIYGNDLKGIVK